MNREEIDSIKTDLRASIELNFIDNYDIINSRINTLNLGIIKLSERLNREIDKYTYDEYCVTMISSFDEGYENLDKEVFDRLDITESDKIKIVSTANIYLANNNGIVNDEDLRRLIDLELGRVKHLKFDIFFNDISNKIWKIFIKSMLLLKISKEELDSLDISFDDDFDNILNQILKD